MREENKIQVIRLHFLEEIRECSFFVDCLRTRNFFVRMFQIVSESLREW